MGFGGVVVFPGQSPHQYTLCQKLEKYLDASALKYEDKLITAAGIITNETELNIILTFAPDSEFFLSLSQLILVTLSKFNLGELYSDDDWLLALFEVWYCWRHF